MGDRAILLFSDERGLEPYAVYHHWAGSEGVAKNVAKAADQHKGRLTDTSYFAARYVEIACESAGDGSTGVGLMGAPTADQLTDHAAMAEYSHGDAGVAILELPAGKLTWIPGTGYGAETQAA